MALTSTELVFFLVVDLVLRLGRAIMILAFLTAKIPSKIGISKFNYPIGLFTAGSKGICTLKLQLFTGYS
jgi:hypothetical protein